MVFVALSRVGGPIGGNWKNILALEKANIEHQLHTQAM